MQGEVERSVNFRNRAMNTREDQLIIEVGDSNQSGSDRGEGKEGQKRTTVVH